MRTRILGKMLNSEVQEYLKRNDIIFVAVGTTEMHGGRPLDCETVMTEAFAVKMAANCDGLVLTGLPYFYAGATASGRGTVQVSIREGIDYLGAIARNLLRLGFKRQVYLSFHGPAHMTISPMIRDFYDETGIPILQLDCCRLEMNSTDLLTDPERNYDEMFAGAYKIMNRLEDLPLVTGFQHAEPQSCTDFNDLFALGYQSAAVGYCFGENRDHASTGDIPDVQTRSDMAERGAKIISEMINRLDLPHIMKQLQKLEQYGLDNERKYPWMPSAWNKKH